MKRQRGKGPIQQKYLSSGDETHQQQKELTGPQFVLSSRCPLSEEDDKDHDDDDDDATGIPFGWASPFRTQNVRDTRDEDVVRSEYVANGDLLPRAVTMTAAAAVVVVLVTATGR
uniref:Uncharacterized protein n=1 Tax=Anopheles atroparvus TaxID=41427 RepID=A0A182J2X1_ANOAO